MHLGIDMGTSYTKIAALSQGEWLDLSQGSIPSVAAYVPATGRLYFGHLALRLDEPGIEKAFFFKLDLKRYPRYYLGPYSLSQVIESFFAFLLNDYIKENCPHLQSVTLAVPNYFGLKARQILLERARQVFAHKDIHLLPEPLAALLAYNTLNPSRPLEGSVLSIDIGGGTTDFSFLDLAGQGQELILESQFQIGHDAFSGSELDHGIIRNIFFPLYQLQTGKIIPEPLISAKAMNASERQRYQYWLVEAEKLKLEMSEQGWAAFHLSDFYRGDSIHSHMDEDSFLNCLELIYDRLRQYCQGALRDRATSLGLADNQGWNLDAILLQGGASQSPQVEQIIQQCFPGIPLIKARSINLVAQGLCCWRAYSHPGFSSLKSIYPFDFYREVFDKTDGQSHLAKIPFDTANLELDVLGRYPILTLYPPSELIKSEDSFSLKIFEVAQGEAITTHQRFQGMETVLDLNWQGSHIPPHIKVYLNLADSCLETSAEDLLFPRVETDISLLPDLLPRQLKSLDLLRNYKYVNPHLIEDLAACLEKAGEEKQFPYENHAQIVYYKLLCLLQILDSR
ncbi:MAG: Hsp70 family protein [Syntrophomonadaceae bacterium]|jgi:hypothetical protein|nr:Hsp70 family protein [Syntrophomonadaceae bacterium]